jgi:diacylglycerol kinase (ATP)
MHNTLIVNPISGRGNGLISIPLIKTFLDREHLEYNIVMTEYPGHAIQLAKEAAKTSQNVIAVGGDGTSNEVINGLMQAKLETGKTARMGVIPVGRGNDFAFSMGIPIPLKESCDCLTSSYYHLIDIGIAYGDNFPNGRYFGNGVGVGFDAVVGFESLKMKLLKGFASYIVAALKTIFVFYHAPLLEVQTENETFQMTALMVSIMNGIRMGGGFFMAPQGNPTDNHFDLCCVKHVAKLATFPLILKFMKGTQGNDPAVKFIQGSKITITAIQGSIPAHADGETVCENGKQVRVELLPHQLELICKPKEQK